MWEQQFRAAPLPVARRWNQQASAGSHALDPLDATRRKLLYRSKQRGWLEMDIMLGNWAAANLPRLQEAELQQFQRLSIEYHGTGRSGTK